MTVGQSLCYVEVEVPIVRQMVFGHAQVGESVAEWDPEFNILEVVGVEDEDFVSGKAGQVSILTDFTSEVFTFTQAPSLEDVSILAQFKLDDPQDADTRLIAIHSRMTPGGNYYQVVLATFSGLSFVSANAVVAFSSTSIITNVQTTVDFFLPTWVRFDTFTTDTGVTLRVKVWNGELSDEPEEFTHSGEDTSSLIPGAGGAGFSVFANTDFLIATLGAFFVRAFEETEVVRFSYDTEDLPPDIETFPSLQSVNYSPATVSLGRDLGRRSSVTANFRDHPHMFYDEPFDVGTFWGKWRARYGTKLRGMPFRLIHGLLGQSLEDMETRHFYLESMDGPSPSGVYTMVAQDPLKFLDDERAQAPLLSEGQLGGGIDDDDTAATLVPTGVGSTYPASGHGCIGGKEVVAFTRSGDALTITRGQLGTAAIAHSAGDRFQLVLNYDGDDVADIVYDLITNYTDFDPAYIDLSGWQEETAANLNVLYARAITEPTGVNKLISELIDQAALALAWDDIVPTLRLQVLRQIATDAEVISEDIILENSLQVKEQPDQRISQHWTFYGQRDPTDRGDNSDNYRAAFALVDLERESDYNGPMIQKTFGSWVPTEAAADRLNQIKISRFRDPPRKFNFDLFRGSVEGLRVLNGYRLTWRQYQDLFGRALENGAPIQVTRVSVEPGLIRVEAEEMLASGVVVTTNVVILTDTGVSNDWEVPDDWNDANNSIHCIGGGGGGGGGGGDRQGSAAGGGAYSRVENVNLTPAAVLDYRVGIGGTGGDTSPVTVPTDGGNTWFNGTSLASATCSAEGGQSGANNTNAAGGAGGQATNGIGDVKFSGGNGGEGNDNGGPGGGGAAGPNGNGANGGNGSGGEPGGGGGSSDGGDPGGNATNSVHGAGGNNRFDFGGGTTSGQDGVDGAGGAGAESSSSTPGGDGGPGLPLWTQTIAPIFSAGPGGGGGGSPGDGGNSARGGHGGLYGGGGGASGENCGPGGTGAQGCIVIIWTPA